MQGMHVQASSSHVHDEWPDFQLVRFMPMDMPRGLPQGGNVPIRDVRAVLPGIVLISMLIVDMPVYHVIPYHAHEASPKRAC